MKPAEEIQKDLDAALLAVTVLREERDALRLVQRRLVLLLGDKQARIRTLEEMRDLSTRAMQRTLARSAS